MKEVKKVIDFSKVIIKSVIGTLPPDENARLCIWLKTSIKNRKLYRSILSSDKLIAREKIYESIDIAAAWDKIAPKINKHEGLKIWRTIVKYAAVAAIFIAVFITGIYLYKNESSDITAQIDNEITPGHKNAILIKSDGKNINLANIDVSDMVENDGTVIKNENNELNYAGQTTDKNDKLLTNTLMVPKGCEYNLVLSDGTKIYVNAMSKVIFPVQFANDKREIILEGEAYFQVAKDESKPFIVTVNGMTIEVIGTSFNIKAYADESMSYTTLVEGKVRMTADLTGTSYILEPDQQAVYDHSTSNILIHNVDARMQIQWINGRYVFSDQPLEDIVKTLSRWYDFEYRFENDYLKNIRFSGGLDKYENITPIIEILNKTGKVNISVNSKEILFLEKD